MLVVLVGQDSAITTNFRIDACICMAAWVSKNKKKSSRAHILPMIDMHFITFRKQTDVK